MNKKQLIVAWTMGIIISLIFFVTLTTVSYSNGLDNLLNSFGYSIPVLIIGGLLLYTLRSKETKKMFNRDKKLPRLSEVIQLIQSESYKEALGIVINLFENKEWSESSALKWGKLCADGYATSLYAAGAEFQKNKQYNEAISVLNELSNLLIKQCDFFELNRDGVMMIYNEIKAQVEKNPVITAEQLKELRDKTIKKTEQLFKDKYKVGNIKMLFDAVMMPALFENLKEDKSSFLPFP